MTITTARELPEALRELRPCGGILVLDEDEGALPLLRQDPFRPLRQRVFRVVGAAQALEMRDELRRLEGEAKVYANPLVPTCTFTTFAAWPV